MDNELSENWSGRRLYGPEIRVRVTSMPFFFPCLLFRVMKRTPVSTPSIIILNSGFISIIFTASAGFTLAGKPGTAPGAAAWGHQWCRQRAFLHSLTYQFLHYICDYFWRWLVVIGVVGVLVCHDKIPFFQNT